MKIGLSIALHGRHALASRVMQHYSAITLRGHELVLHAIGSSEEDEAVAVASGWIFDLYPNDNLGTKRNAGLAALRAIGVDAVIRIGSDDLISAPLLQRMADALAGGARGVTIRGSFVMDEATGEMIDVYRTDYALGIGLDVLEARGWDLYDESHRVPDRMFTAYIAGRKSIVLQADAETPFLQIKTADAINTFERIKARSIWQPADAGAVLAHFEPTEADTETEPEKPKRKRRAAPAPSETED